MTLVSICTSARRNDHASHLFVSQLEWTAHSALKPRERQGEFEARQIVIRDGDWAIEASRGSGALAEILGVRRFLPLKSLH
jgi:hypothetical protein